MQIDYKGIIIDVKEGTQVKDLLHKEINTNRDDIIACKFENEVKSLSYKIEKNGTIDLIYLTDKDGMRVYKRGLIYIISKAFNELFPEALLTINYQLYNSMFF